MNGARLQGGDSVMKKITELLEMCGDDNPPMPPTVLYCEGWLLRLVLHWFWEHKTKHQFALHPRARWYSEAQLSSRFREERRGEKIDGKRVAESNTYADGVLGHFDISPEERGGGQACLRPDAKQFIVIEAKLGSPLEKRIANAKNYDYGQASRTVACMAHMVSCAGLCPDALESFKFYVTAPEKQIKANVFEDFVTKQRIRAQVEERVARHCGRYDKWLEVSFLPALEKIEVGILSWESIIEHIEKHESSRALGEFYEHCLRHAKLS